MCECGVEGRLWRPKSRKLTFCYMNIPRWGEVIWPALKIQQLGLFEIIHQIYILSFDLKPKCMKKT
jgi:hypothetical protein